MLIQNTPKESLKKSGQNLRMSTLNANTQIHKYTNALIPTLRFVAKREKKRSENQYFKSNNENRNTSNEKSVDNLIQFRIRETTILFDINPTRRLSIDKSLEMLS